MIGQAKVSNQIIIIEAGKNKYSESKMQSSGLFMYVLENDDTLKKNIARITAIKEMRPTLVCYIIGSSAFTENVKKVIEKMKRNLNWTCCAKYNNEDSIMSEQGIAFPVNESEVSKETKKEVSQIGEQIQRFSCKDFSDEEIAGVLLAADDLEHLKIFPPTDENIYRAFVRMSKKYIQDEERAQKVVDFFLAEISQKSGLR